MRLEKAIAVSLAVHLAAGACLAVAFGIKRCPRSVVAPSVVFAELLDSEHRGENPAPAPRGKVPQPIPPSAAEADAGRTGTGKASAPGPEMSRAPEPEPLPVRKSAPGAALAAAAPPPPDNVAPATAPEDADPGGIALQKAHGQAMASTMEFYRFTPHRLTRIVTETLAGASLMSQGDALIHMDVTPDGQVSQAHVQASSPALQNRLELVAWADALPPRPQVRANAIHLRVSVVGTEVRVSVEIL
jgi:hypothetical protein